MKGYIIKANGVDNALYVVDQVIMPVVTMMPVPKQPGAPALLGHDAQMPMPMAVTAYMCFECEVNGMVPNGMVAYSPDLGLDDSPEQVSPKVDINVAKIQYITPDNIIGIICTNDDFVSISYVPNFIYKIEWPTIIKH